MPTIGGRSRRLRE